MLRNLMLIAADRNRCECSHDYAMKIVIKAFETATPC